MKIRKKLKNLFKKVKDWLKGLFRHDVDSPDAVEFSALKWTYGGVDGSNARLTEARMAGLSVSKTKLSHSWSAGSCESLGSPSPSDAVCRACLFCHVGGEWVGGMFEWTGTTRTSRSLANIEGKYKGWDYGKVLQADRFAYVITNKGATLRTNVVVQAGAAKGAGNVEFPPAEFPISQLD